MIELASALPDLNVQSAEYTRLLGYPRGWVLEGRALELADWARELVRQERAPVGLCASGGDARNCGRFDSD